MGTMKVEKIPIELKEYENKGKSSDYKGEVDLKKID